MSMLVGLLALSPVVVPLLVFGTLVVVALCRARREDVPTVMREAAAEFRRLAGRPPAPRLRSPDGRAAAEEEDERCE